MNTHEQIQQLITQNPVVLFMKGTPTFPQCGFSSAAVQILKNCGAQFTAINVLSDEALRQGIKDYANWPTIPQLYIQGEFVGGADIMKELYNSGELQKQLASLS